MKKKANFYKQFQNLIPVDNIVSEWRLESDFTDSFGSNDGTQLGSISYVSGIIGNGLNSVNSGSGFYAPDNDNMSFGNGTTDSPFSISLWFYPLTGIPLTTSIYATFCERRATDNTSREYLLAWFGPSYSGSLVFRLLDTTSNNSGTNIYLDGYYTAGSIAAETWYHLVGTYDGSGSASGLKIYLDGVDVTTGSASGGGTYTAMGNKAIPTTFMKSANNTTASFRGIEDEIVLFDKELTAAEVYAIYEHNLNGNHTSD